MTNAKDLQGEGQIFTEQCGYEIEDIESQLKQVKQNQDEMKVKLDNLEKIFTDSDASFQNTLGLIHVKSQEFKLTENDVKDDSIDADLTKLFKYVNFVLFDEEIEKFKWENFRK